MPLPRRDNDHLPSLEPPGAGVSGIGSTNRTAAVYHPVIANHYPVLSHFGTILLVRQYPLPHPLSCRISDLEQKSPQIITSKGSYMDIILLKGLTGDNSSRFGNSQREELAKW